MRVSSTRLLAVSLLALGLAACDKTADLPDGQVVATVDGKEVTIHELNAELAQVRADQNTPRKLLEQVALARVIERKMLANEARVMKLDARPEFLLSQTRASESLLVQALQSEVTGQVPRATREAS
ncbi:SurA N-terminal domain-containing protein, partial [Polymorphobacter multimanifer]